MKLHWLLLPGTLLTISLSSSPVQAAQLQFWRFDASQNRLEFTTTGNVQPRAQLIFNPTRLVIDLPDTRFGRPQVTQTLGGTIRSLRVGQFEQETTRIVLELAPGYTLDPQQVKFIGMTGSRWTVQIPRPKPDSNAASPRSVYSVVNRDGENPGNSISRVSPEAVVATRDGVTQVESLQTTGDGFFVRTSGTRQPSIRVNRSRDRTTVFVDISEAALSTNFRQRDQYINRYGVSNIQFIQLQNPKPTVRLVMRVNRNSSDWRASTSGTNGLVLLPDGNANRFPGNNSNNSNNSNSEDNRPLPPISRRPPSTSLTTIESVDIADNNGQLVIRGDRPIYATSGWDRESMMFRITVSNARLADSVRGPQLNANSPILRVRLRQEDSRTVVIFVQPAPGVEVGRLSLPGRDSISLDLNRSSRNNSPILSLPLPRPNPQPLPGDNPNTPISRPRNNNGRLVVLIDPGHGGKDSGAVGIGGALEKDVILPISLRVAQILQQNGIQVVLTRNSDYFVTLPGRVEMAERVNASVFVSIHANSAGANRPEVNGLEVYYYDSGLGLARLVHNSIMQSVNIRDRGVRRARFYVLRKSSMPSILVETGFMTGAEDMANLRTSSYQNKMAEGIANGILKFLRVR
ncbi:N-acetylmuramoyl-L-alanine amidase [Calothrix sp. 336/3]|uniref:N-acetylmuramoyl-L-alanine amidase n=1 Tax=Calothrix sp. 336/3 TaxID=1337936 RepID=UPI0004E3B448|nr:N-acetylmuramoyl-L-alanine amidase [Calothrix sp. 336/3]AKG22846.1 N-acetylmuramoyl-L-alanine amidase [Calothrix sp. 336/3]